MKKTILAAAVAAAVMAAPMTAAANVVIYGKIHASLDYVSQDSYDRYLGEVWISDNEVRDGYFEDVYETIDGRDNWEVTSRTSRLGFKGSEDLGNGLKAIWKIEVGYGLDGTSRKTTVSGDTSTDGEHGGHLGFFNWNRGDHWHDVYGSGTLDGGGWGIGRNSYIGLAGDWGTFLVGKHDTPLKISTGRLDVFADTMADYNTTVGFVDRRPGNTIAYISPNWNGFTFAVAGVASEDYSGDLGDGGYSLAAMYFNNGFYASLAFEDVSDLGLVDLGRGYDFEFDTEYLDKNQIFRAGLGYIMNAFTFGLVYENQEVDLVDGGDYARASIDKWMIVGAYDFGNNTVKAMYGNYDIGVDNRDGGDTWSEGTDYDAWSIGFDHKLSVRTKVYALYADSELGLHNHSSTYFTGGDGFSMGMVHTF